MIIKLNQINPHFIDSDFSSSQVYNTILQIGKEDKVVIEANSGKGKSTILNFIYGLRNDYDGTITFDGTDIKSFDKKEWAKIRRDNLSIIFQDLKLFHTLNTLDNLLIKNELTNYKTIDEIKLMIDRLGMTPHINKKVSLLSFGQRQRVAIIRALLQPFDFLLMDEPFSHLDKENIELASELIKSECDKQNAGFLLCSLGYEYGFSNLRKVVL